MSCSMWRRGGDSSVRSSYCGHLKSNKFIALWVTILTIYLDNEQFYKFRKESVLISYRGAKNWLVYNQHKNYIVQQHLALTLPQHLI
jgi:hypothetical protein